MFDSVRPHRRQPTRLPRPWDSPGKNTGVVCHFLLQCMKVKSESEVAQSCLTLSNPMDCSLPGSSVHGIFQARVLEWGAIAFSRLSIAESTFWCSLSGCTGPQSEHPLTHQNKWSQNLSSRLQTIRRITEFLKRQNEEVASQIEIWDSPQDNWPSFLQKNEWHSKWKKEHL